jgi:hypothetical protein
MVERRWLATHAILAQFEAPLGVTRTPLTAARRVSEPGTAAD